MTKKFSEFPLVTTPDPALSYFVGLDEAGDNARFPMTLIASGGTNGHIIQDEGVDLAQQVRLNFVGAGVTAANVGAVTTVTIPGGGGGGGAVDSVNGEIGAVLLDAADIPGTPMGMLSGTNVQSLIAQLETRTKQAGFRHLADNEPILIVCIGDSNAAGSTDINTSLVAPNSNIYYYALATDTEPYNISNLGWRNLDPNSTLRSTQQSNAAGAGQSMTGQLLGGSNPPDMMAAYALVPQTGRKVYVYKNALGLQLSGSWISGSHAGYPRDVDGYTPTFGANNSAVTQAIAAFNTANPSTPKTFADIVIFSLGANDIDYGNLTGPQFYTNMQAIWNSAVAAGWLNPTYTQVFHLENVNNSQANIVARYKTGWTGYSLMAENNSERYTLVSSFGVPTVDATNLHFTCAGYQIQGRVIANMAIAGSTPKNPIRQNTFMEKLLPVAGGPLNMGGFGITNLGAMTGSIPMGGFDISGIGSLSFLVDGLITTNKTPGVGVDAGLRINTAQTYGGGDEMLQLTNNGTITHTFFGAGALECRNAAGTAWRFQVGAFDQTWFFEPINYGPLVTHTSQVPDGGTAIAHKFISPAYTNINSKLASFFNATSEKAYISLFGDAHFEGALDATNATLTGWARIPVVRGIDTGSTFHAVRIQPIPADTTRYFEFQTHAALLVPTLIATHPATFTINSNAPDGINSFNLVSSVNHTSADIFSVTNTGSGTKLRISFAGAPGFWGKAPVAARPTANSTNNTPAVTGAGGAVTINNTSYFQGSTGSSGYTINDIVSVLKDVGLLAA